MRLSILFILFCSTTLVKSQQKRIEFYNYQNQKHNLILSKSDSLENFSPNKILDSLQQIGYFTISIDSVVQETQSTKYYINQGKLYKKIWVKNDTIFPNFKAKKEWLVTKDLDSLQAVIYQKYAAKGYPFVEIKTKPLGFVDNELRLAFELNLFKKRKIDGIKIIGYNKFNPNYLRYGLGLNIGDEYNEQKLLELSNLIQNSNAISQTRSPQTLFRTDSTLVYLYLKKQASNFFDGIIGFGNDENGDFRLNGNVDLRLNNNFNGLEQILLHWQSTPERNSTLRLQVRIPYWFKSAIGTQTEFELFRQDSVFVNTKLQQNFFYQINQNSSIGLNLALESSNFVLNQEFNQNSQFQDYNKTGVGVSYLLASPIKKRILEPKNFLQIQANNYTRQADEQESNNQYQVGVQIHRIFNLSKNHLLKPSIEANALFSQSDAFLENELFRFGGFNSLRGFNEQSLVANSYAIGRLDYRYLPNDAFYASLFTDFGYLENTINNFTENLLGVGLGFSFLTKFGVFNLSYAVGKFSNTSFDFNNSKVHFGLLSRF